MHLEIQQEISRKFNGVKYIATKVDGVDMNELRNLGDKLKGEIGSGVVVIVSAQVLIR